MAAPKSLELLQHWFQKVVTDPEGVSASIAADPTGLKWVRQAPPLSVEDRLAIYSDSYISRMVEVLSSDFELVAWVLGKDAFEAAAARYCMGHPSRFFNIGNIGANFPEFLRGDRQGEALPYLADLATLERALWKTVFLPSSPLLDPALLAAVAPDQWARVKLFPDESLRLLNLSWPVDAIWDAHEKNKSSAEAPEELLELEPETRHLAVFWHPNRGEALEVLSAAQSFTLELLRHGRTLEEVCSVLSETPSFSGELANAMSWFGGWMQSGLIRQLQ